FSLRLQEGSNYTISGNTVIPDKDFYGTLTIPVTVNDGKADSTVFSLTVAVSNVNDTPEITSEPVTGATEDEPYSYKITVSDGDPEDSFTVSSDNLPPWLALEGAVLSGTPGNEDTGEYSITLTVTDKEGGKTFQSFTLIVAGVNDAPVIIAQNTLSTPETVALTVEPDDLIVEDPDNIYPEEFTMTLYPGDNYSLEGQTLTPLAGFIGMLTVPVSVNDGKAESPKYALTVEVTEKPEIRSISGTVTGLEKDREIYINAVSRDLDEFIYIRIRGTGEEIIPYIIENLKPSEDYRVEISSTDYAYQVWNGKETWETADELDMSERSAVGVDFTFTPPEAEISGRIFFPESAQAGQSVLIRAYSPSTGSGGSTEIFLDENGAWDVSYTISRLLPADDYTVSLSSDTYLTRYFSGDGGSGVSGEGNAAAVSTRSGESVDFIPDGGARISGFVTGEDNSGLRVEAWSDSLDAGSGGLTSSDGSFAVSGLEGAEDFRISVLRAEKSPIFYHPEGSVYDREKAGPVSTMSGSADNISITLPEEKSIAGRVQNEAGEPLSGIWVDAQSLSQAAGGSAFSMEDGTYEIKGLPPAADYTVTARTDRENPYSPAELSGIEAGERNADFLLASRPLLHIRGLILDSEGEPVPNVRVEISSDSLDIFVTSLDDLSGMQDLHIPNEYEIHGLPPADDYTVTAWPPADSPFAVFIRTGVSVREDTDMNIIMTASFSLSGNISDAADTSPLAGARVIAYSARKSFRSETVSGTDGSYRITNLPDTWDYRLTVTAEGYGSAEMINLSPSGDRDFLLHSVGEISGSVSDENGDPLTAVPVEILSPAADSATGFSGSVLTDKNGKFTVKGLHRYYDDGSPAEDYTLTAYPDDSPPLEAYGLKPDDRVELRITGENVTEFTGSVRNADGSLLPEGVDVFIDIFEEDGIFVMTADVSADGSFRNTSLHPERLYGLKFMAFAGDTLLAGEWAGQDGNGVNSQNLAGVFDPAAPLNFRFAEMVRVPSSRRADYRAEISTSEENGVRNLRSLPFETVYKDGILTVLWDPSLLGEDPDTGEKYYYVFNQDSLFSVSKRTAPRRRPLTVRTVTPESFRGDNSDFLCHVAPVDIRGQIGETRSLPFRVDTVPPLNPKISLPAKTTDRYVTLKLGAAGAAEMYLSNIAYGQGGIWEVRSQEKEWRLTEGDGLKKIYARFRDRAGNVVNAFATTEKVPDFDPDTQHKITVNAGPGGAVEPSGEVLVNSGDDLTLNVSPDTGYGTGTVTVDNIPVRLNNNSQFTLISIRADHTFAVTFAPLSEKTHVITATAGPYGSISPSGNISVPEGTDQVFSIVPVEGYGIAEVLADGQPVTPDADGGFVFRNVTGDHSISVTFR
ncbi:MAG: carboxypeptidase regulatory-like domain-containing protein, partial [Desulfococcaceae bacterium]|nr:carboxypeptidase regulatory-like domain-containing protein [Desulfococcaceae bacterium]